METPLILIELLGTLVLLDLWRWQSVRTQRMPNHAAGRVCPGQARTQARGGGLNPA